MKSKILSAVLVALLSATSITVHAAQDESQRQATLRLQAAKQKLQQAEAAKGADRHALMAEHMKMMKEIMDKMVAMKPKAGMTMQQHEEWINEHQSLMQKVMEQMQDDHRMMMQPCAASAH